MRKPKKYTQPNMNCMCKEVGFEDSITFFSKNGVPILVYHKDCPEHGMIDHGVNDVAA